MAERIAQSVAIRVTFQAFLASDHISPATGKTIAVTISKNGAAFGNPAAGATNATAIATGSYYVDLGTGDTDTLGPLVIHGAEGTIDNVDVHMRVVNANNWGIAALPNAAAEAAGGLYTRGTGAGQIAQDANGNVRVNVDTIKTNPVVNAGTVTFPTGATLASTTNITGGTITTVTNLTNAPTAGDLTATMKTSVTTAASAATPTVTISTGTGAGQLDITSGVVKANAVQLLGGTIPAPNVTGVPIVDVKYWLGSVVPTPTTAGLPDVNIARIHNVVILGDGSATPFGV